jgi:hypothetical protein
MSLDAGDDSDDGQKFDRILIQRISTELKGGDRGAVATLWNSID